MAGSHCHLVVFLSCAMTPWAYKPAYISQSHKEGDYSRSYKAAHTGEWHSDPRLQSLGQRIVLPAQDKPTSPAGEPETESIQYKSWRMEHGVAEGDTEMPSGRAHFIHSFIHLKCVLVRIRSQSRFVQTQEGHIHS